MAAFTFNPLVLSARAVAPAKATRSTRRAAKSALDPAAILNPGVLVDP